MSRPASVLVAAALLLVLAVPAVQADHSTSTCSDTELPLLGPGDGCTLEGLDFDLADDPRHTVEVATLDDGYTFTGKIHVTFEDDQHTATMWAGMVGGLILDRSGIGQMPTDDVTVTVDLRSYEGMEPTGTWKVTVNHHQA